MIQENRKHCINRKRLVRTLLLLVLTVNLLSAERVLAQTSITLKPGETYDLSKAGKNTSVYINKPGTYTLKGTTRYVRVVICCGDVKCYLDNVNMNAGAYTQTGQVASPMNIVDDGGTVTLISKKGTKNYFEGYGMPAIRKQGTNTELVFKTEDPNNPGEIKCLAGVWGSAAIGSTREFQMGNKTCGNFTFESGKVIAQSKGGGAAIGGGSCVDGKYFKIKGGEVIAYGSEEGAGIGAGNQGYASNIEITGGKVYAEAGYDSGGAAAIGGGGGQSGGNSRGIGTYNVYLRGGDITAISHGAGAAIGGGKNQGVSCLYITGGNIDAKATESVSVAIGAGYGKYLHADVHIRGGNITAESGSDAPAIGARKSNAVDDNTVRIDINGGNITAKGGSSYGWDIGGGRDDMETTITGGTVYAKRIQGKAVITGGSVFADDIQEGAINEEDEELHRVDVQFQGVDEGIPIGNLGYSGGKYSYGMADVVTMEGGYFYPWFPKDNDQISLRTAYAEITSSKSAFYGSIPFSDDSGILKQATDITLKTADYQEGKAGSATGIPGEDHLKNITKPDIPPKTVAVGYYTSQSSSAQKIADMDGKLEANVSGYTNASSKWIYENEAVTFYCKTRQFQYSIHFDPNPPKNASTKGKLSGSMADKTECNYMESVTLPANGFTLPGYEFDGWNTKANGTGTHYADQDNSVKSLSDKDGGTATLYAQWKPKKYNLTLDSGAINKGQITSEDFTFDASGTIPKLPESWQDEYRTFHCWQDEDGNYYDDQEDFFNLVRYDTGGNPISDGNKLKGQTLTALWIEHGKIAVTITVDGKPEAGHESDLKLIDKNDTSKPPYTPAFTYANGIYEYVSPGDETDPDYIPPGEYELVFNPGTAQYVPVSEQINYQLDGTASIIFDYHTISIEEDPALDEDICSVSIEGHGFIAPTANNTVFVPDEVQLDIGTYMNPDYGYHFDGYSVLGIIPGDENNTDAMDLVDSEQTITARGAAAIMAHAEANIYTVHFDANADSGVTGEMGDQDMVYDQPQDLFANQFKRVGGDFAGWNTERDGSGTSFEDGQSVKNLTKENGGEITLYAQWEMQQYSITYDLDGGQLPGDAFNPEKYTAADTFTLINPEQKDYIFMGWSGTDIDDRAMTVTIPLGSTGDREYIACWTSVQYYVYFESNGGSYVEPEIVTIHNTVTKPEDPTREHYSFAGWYVDEALTQPYDFSTEVTEEITLYAKWEHIKHSITYDLNGGTLNGKTGQIVVEANEGDVIRIMDAPTRKGYTFKYWEGSEYYPGDSYTVAEDHTLKAIWKKNKNPNPVDPDDPDNPDDTDDNGGVKTGDEQAILPWLTLMLLSLLSLTVMTIVRRTRRN